MLLHRCERVLSSLCLGLALLAVGDVARAFPELSVSNPMVLEGNSADCATTNMVFVVTSTEAAPAGGLTFEYHTTNLSAVSGGIDPDFIGIPINTQATIDPGEFTEEVIVQIHCDDVIEPDETMMLVPEDEAGYDLVDGGWTVGTGTIVNDEPLPVLSIGDAVMAENCVEPMMFPVRSDIVAPEGGITFQYYTIPGTALPADFNEVFVWPAVYGTIPEGATETSVPVDILCDEVPEDDEVFSAALLMNPAFYSLGNSTGYGTIVDYDGIVLTISDQSEVEGNGTGLSHMQFELMLSEPAPIDIPLHVQVAGITASSPADFTAFDTDVIVSEGELRVGVPVTFRRDTAIEADETFSVTVSGASFNAATSDPEAIGTIVDDDVEQLLRIDDTETVEGDDGTTNAVFTVSLDHPIPAGYGAVTVNYSTTGATAVADVDYTPVGGQLVFSGGVTSRSIEVPIRGDLGVEENESFDVVLSDPNGTNLSIADDAGVGTIVDDDVIGVFVDDVEVTEGDAGTTQVQFEVSLDRAPPGGDDVQIAFETRDGTAAVSGSDYLANGGTLIFNAGGALTRLVQVTINGDTAVETDETLELHLSLQSGLDTVIVDAIGVATIRNDDHPAAPQFVIHNQNLDQQVFEGAGAPAAFSVTLLLPDPPPAGTFDVDVGLTPGSATPDADFAFAPQTLHLSADDASATLLVPVLDDTDVEGDEQFGLALSNPSAGASIGAEAAAHVTLVDDESLASPVFVVSANADSLHEHSGTASFTVQLLSAGAAGDFEITFSTQGGTPGAATPGSDFVPRVGQILVLNASAPEVIVPVALVDDAVIEAGETLSVQISGPSGGAVVGNAVASTVLLDNDEYHQQISTSDVEVVEGDPGDAVTATFAVSLSTPIPAGFGPASVRFETVGVSAAPGLDFVQTTGTLVFEEDGALQQQVQVALVSDQSHEDDEFFGLVLSDPQGVNLALPNVAGMALVHDDDALPAVSVDDLILPEGDAPGTVAQVRVRLSTPIAAGSGMISVKYSTQDDTAAADDDYTPASGTLEFHEGGPLEALIAVPIGGDTAPEPDEAFLVQLSNIEAGEEGAVLLDDTARVTIQNDDVPIAPAFVIQNLDSGHVVYEGIAPVAVFQVMLLSPFPPVAGGFEVDVTSLAGSATQGADYAAVQQTVELSADHPTAFVFVDILDDALHEADEGFSLTLSNPTNGAVLGFATSAGVTIADDDSVAAPVLTLSADLPAVSEGAGHADFTIRLLPDDAAGPVEVRFETEDGVGGATPATAGVDYEPIVSESFVLGAGSNAVTVPVPIVDDAQTEGDEAISGRIVVVSGDAAFGAATATAVILDNDAPVGDHVFSDGFED